MKKLTIIDTFGFFFRNYYALPYLKTREGFPTGLLTGFINFVTSLYKEYSTDYIIFALDSKGDTFRHKIDPNYKANRKTPPQDLTTQLPIAIKWIEEMGFASMGIEGYEADDIIASLVKWGRENNLFIQIVSHDKDLYQLIEDDKVVLYDPSKKITIDSAECKKKYGVNPKNIVDYLSIVGDSSDNIAGVKGIGAKGAIKLIEEFDSLGNIYDNLDKILNARSVKLLKESKESAFLSKKLVMLDNSLVNSFDINNLTLPNEPLLNIKNSLLEYGIKAVFKRVANEEIKEKKTIFKATLLDTKEKLFKIVDNIEDNTIIAFDTETTSLDSKSAKIVGFSFAMNEKEGFYVPIGHNYLGVEEQIDIKDAKEALEKLFTHKIVGQNIKYDLEIIYHNFGLELNIFADTMVISWLIDPEISAGLDNMANRYFNYEMIKFKDVVKKGKNFSSIEIERACKYASEDAWMTLKIYNYLFPKLSDNLKELASKLEFPFIKILANMERVGIKIDIDFFETLSQNTQNILNRLTNDIHNLSDTKFNINSPKQLGVVLFEKLKLTPIKKTKTGYSTNEQVLEKLIEEHQIISKILEYRELHKLKSTYIEPLIKYAKESKNHRIHTSYFQTGTATGRLSSKNPNLQNIPVRSELGRQIRYGFKAKKGYKLLSVDYSQIELRLLAHFSQDEALIEAFKNDFDIHLETSTKIFGSNLAKQKRDIAKTINFGLLYGMGARKLSQTLKISQKEAKEYIDNYFASFPTVKEYIIKVHNRVQKEGFVETLLKRKRYFNFSSASEVQKAGFLRESLNTIFQGSTADLIKLSMLETSLLETKEIKMLLQIHDELIFEIKQERVEEFAIQIKKIMENIDKKYDIELKIPLKVGIAIGDNWGELK